MKYFKRLTFLMFVIPFLFTQTAMAHSRNQLTIGPGLKNYNAPAAEVCNLHVPAQFSTIQAAIDASVDGDTVCVAAGTYKENVYVNKSITLAGSGFTNLSVIKGQTNNYFGTLRIDADNVTVEGFVVKGVGSNYQTAALHIHESHSGDVVQYNRIYAGNGELAFSTDGYQSHQIIQHNVLHGNNSPQIALVNGQPSVSKPSDDTSFANNKFTGTVLPTTRDDTGIELQVQSTNNHINRNVFNAKGTIHEIIQCSYASNTINENNLISTTFSPLTNTPVKVRAGFDGTTNAENNWWGDLDPSDNIQGIIDFTSFATREFPGS